MPEHDARRLVIARTFTLPGRNDCDILYVEFSEESELKKVRSFAKFMESEGDKIPRIVNFIPRVLQASYAIVIEQANIGRAKTPKHSSKIWVGKSEFELRLRLKGDTTPWSQITPEIITTKTNNNPRVPHPSPRVGATPKPTALPEIANSGRSNCRPANSDIRIPSPGLNFRDDPNNANFQVIGGARKKTYMLGAETLLPKSISITNRYQPLTQIQQIRP